MKLKKAQMEIFGLALIVILITLGMLFVLQATMTEKPSSLKTDYSNTEIASNMVNAILGTTMQNCNEMTINKLLIDCAEHEYLDTRYTCNDALSSDSCTAANETITSIIDSTLGRWRKTYYFSAGVENRTLTNYGNKLASSSISSSTKKGQPLSTKAGTLTITLSIYEKY